MSRHLAVIGAAVVAVQLVCASAQAVPATESQVHGDHRHLAGVSPPPPSHSAAPYIASKHRRRPLVAQVPSDPQPGPVPELSYQEERVVEVAKQNGDRDFLMVDKALGRIILFSNGNAIFGGSALTGESTADRLPPDALAEKFSKLSALDTKVTPAGRFTVRRGRDRIYGPLLDINEILGKDWGIAIHQVYVGIPSENRIARLRSPNDGDKHITYGCINVTPETIRFLMKELPRNRATPLYILPQDETRTAEYFTPRNS